MHDLHYYIVNLGFLVLFINVVLSWRVGEAVKSQWKFFSFFLLLGLVVQITGQILWLKSKNNLPLLHIYTLLEFIFLSLFYRSIFSSEENSKRKFDFFILMISLLIVLNTLLLQPLLRFNSNAKTLTQLIYIGYAVFYFFRFQHRPDDNASGGNYILVNSGVLIYYAASLFIFMFSNVLLKIEGSQTLFWMLNALLYLGFQLLILYWLWKVVFQKMKFI